MQMAGVACSSAALANGTKNAIEAPPEDSDIVQEQVKIILEAVNLKALVKDLTNLPNTSI